MRKKEKTPYNDAFFDKRSDSLDSAEVIVPLVHIYIKPTSVLDVGSGTGAFLSIFAEQGAEDILGIDGPWVKEEQLCIPKNNFQSADLEEELKLDRKFDLVVSLEVAEHLPKEKAQIFVRNLTRHGDVILFSAAIPYQGGTHHVNEQWPTYWSNFFEKEGYVPIDCLRLRVWNNEQVSFWYAQNMFFFVRRNALSKHTRIQEEFNKTKGEVLSLVHPRFYETKAIKAERFDRLTRFIPYSAKNFLLKLFGLKKQ